MKHLTNLYDPTREDAKSLIITMPGETPGEAWERQKRYLADKVIGLPKATGAYSVQELERMGMVGIYASEEQTGLS